MAQTIRGMEIVIVDNSGHHEVTKSKPADVNVRILEMPTNVGFGGAINAGFLTSNAEYLATINDDARASPQWLEKLVEVMEKDPSLGCCASSVRLAETGVLDSAGMLMARDGSSKQCGHGLPAGAFSQLQGALLPSGSAAIYRRAMMEETGGFDADFFLYCEDTDLGLRACWAGWKCRYVPEAIVEHCYSQSAGRASALKAYLVERNRLRLIVKNFPLMDLLQAPFATMIRYGWHVSDIWRGSGKAREFAAAHSGFQLVWLAAKAHLALLPALPKLLQQRAAIRRQARIPATVKPGLSRFLTCSTFCMSWASPCTPMTWLSTGIKTSCTAVRALPVNSPRLPGQSIRT